jgi:hypothetical protein
MSRPEPGGVARFRDLVIRVADEPGGGNHAAFCQALPLTTVFVKLMGVPDPAAPGERYVVPRGTGVRLRYVHLPNGMQMIRVSAAPPRDVAADEVVATMTGLEALRMVMKMAAQGLVVAAEDDRNSWTAITRDGISAILKGLGTGTQ